MKKKVTPSPHDHELYCVALHILPLCYLEFAQVPKHLPKATELESSKTGNNQTGSSESHDQTVLSNGLDDAIETGQEVIAARAFDDDRQQRKHEIRESKINDLIRKQERLLQALQKMPSSPDQDDDINSP